MKKPRLPSPSRSTLLPPAALPQVAGGSMYEMYSNLIKNRDEVMRSIAASIRA